MNTRKIIQAQTHEAACRSGCQAALAASGIYPAVSPDWTFRRSMVLSNLLPILYNNITTLMRSFGRMAVVGLSVRIRMAGKQEQR